MLLTYCKILLFLLHFMEAILRTNLEPGSSDFPSLKTCLLPHQTDLKLLLDLKAVCHLEEWGLAACVPLGAENVVPTIMHTIHPLWYLQFLCIFKTCISFSCRKNHACFFKYMLGKHRNCTRRKKKSRAKEDLP